MRILFRQVSYYVSHTVKLMRTDVALRVFPDWKVHSSFISDMLNRALSLDAKLSSHPIEVECPDAATINQVCLIAKFYMI